MLRRLGAARLGAWLLLLLLRYVAATIPSCSVCDPPDKQASCRKNVPRKLEVCEVSGRFAHLHNHDWRCRQIDKRHKNPYAQQLWRSFELRPLNALAKKRSNESFAGMGLVAPPQRFGRFSDACWHGSEEGPKGCKAFSDLDMPCEPYCERCDMVDELPGPSVCLLYRDLGEGEVGASVKWMTPNASFCHFEYETHHGWLKQLPSPWEEDELAEHQLFALSPMSAHETWKRMHDQCGRLYFYLQRALYASFPFESNMDLVLTINQTSVDDAVKRFTQQELDSVLLETNLKPDGDRVTLVRYEVYSYGKHEYGDATSFATFHPDSNFHTAAVFEKAFAKDIQREASHCYAVTGVKFVALVAPGDFAAQESNLRLATTTERMWPHLDVTLSKRPGHACQAQSLFGSWSVCFGDAEWIRPVETGAEEETKKPWLQPAHGINLMLQQMQQAQRGDAELSKLQSSRAAATIFDTQKDGLLDAATPDPDANVNPIVALVFLAVLVPVGWVFYQAYAALLPLLVPVLRRKQYKPSTFVPRMYREASPPPPPTGLLRSTHF